MTNDAKKYCPGLAHLRKALRAIAAANGAALLTINDCEDPDLQCQCYSTSDSQIELASEYATEVDGMLFYQIGDAVLQVIYDGPYSEASAAEIINDTNEAAWAIIEGISL